VENAPSAAEQTAYERWIRRHDWNHPGNYVRFAILGYIVATHTFKSGELAQNGFACESAATHARQAEQ